ncbi:PREDICTED: THO complex subunit 4D isoform X2 [Tarenaya hassleriana]|uniref:THO complex subunit 4D isoform X1 n=1 Tax=Tarenaya hassleriana TaxID=28532 RepID=UPI00053C41D1|nr:PREDICTED: THO complex subunit 4D isoform X1 [Tarenaya hassleriana]XP_019058442.1 PREDICTED: THO complex subunit 4D isoform X2 [Tarenaya hassleriana]
MSGSLNMTLDDMVKRRRNERSGGRGRSRRGRGANGFSRGGRGFGPARRGPLAVNARPSSFSITKPVRRVRNLPWQNDLFEESLRAAGVSGVEVGIRLYITNLDQGVTNEDIRELFAEMGELKRYAIHYDKFGQPSGSAEVVYMRRSDAFQALKKYNNVLLDGKPMKIEIEGSNMEAPVSARVNVTGLNGRMKRTVIMGQGTVGRGRGGRGRGRMTLPGKRPLPIQSHSQRGGPRGGAIGGRGRGRGRGGGRGRGRGSGKKGMEKSADELDKDLDNYHAEAMNIS